MLTKQALNRLSCLLGPRWHRFPGLHREKPALMQSYKEANGTSREVHFGTPQNTFVVTHSESPNFRSNFTLPVLLEPETCWEELRFRLQEVAVSPVTGIPAHPPHPHPPSSALGKPHTPGCLGKWQARYLCKPPPQSGTPSACPACTPYCQ